MVERVPRKLLLGQVWCANCGEVGKAVCLAPFQGVLVWQALGFHHGFTGERPKPWPPEASEAPSWAPEAPSCVS